MKLFQSSQSENKIPLKQRVNRWFRCARIYMTFAQRRHPNLLYLWCFLLPAVMMAFCHACIGVFPFGKMSILTLDMNAQYVMFFEALRDWVYGEGSILYSFSRSLGGEFLGMYAYYLASPLSYIVALFPKENITEAIYCMFVIKTGLCGLTFAYFLRKKDNVSPLLTLIFSTTYAFIGYGTIMQHNTMWFDNMILLPLIVLGLYELICHRKYKLYTVCLAVAILSNFYIGYMTCIFVAIYSVFLYLSLTPKRRNPNGEKAHLPRAILRVGLFSAIAVAVSALMILPAYYALSFGKNEFSNPNFSLYNRYSILDLLKQFLFANYDTVRPEGLPIVYSGMLTLILVIFYFACRRIRIRERLCHGLFALVLLFSFSINTIDMIWHGFQMPNWLNYRYSFMLCFILVYMACRAMTHISLVSKKEIITTITALLFVVAVISFYRYKSVSFVYTLLGTVLFLAVYAYLLLKWVEAKPKKPPKWLKQLLVIAVCAEMLLNGIYDLCMLWYDVGMANRASYVEYLAEWQPIIDTVKENDDDFYRMEKLPYSRLGYLPLKRMNEPYALGYRGLTGSTSTLHAGAISFIKTMGISAESHWSEYAGSSPVTDSILGIRYVFDGVGQNRVSSTYEDAVNDGNYVAYKNPYALPIAFCVSDEINKISFQSKPSDASKDDDKTYYDRMYSVFERMNYLVGAMMGEDQPLNLYIIFDDYTKIIDTNLGNYHSTYEYYYSTNGESGKITYILEDSDGKELFLYIPHSPYYYITGNQLQIGENQAMPWFENSHAGTAYIGKIEEGEQTTVSIIVNNQKDGIYIQPVNGSTMKSYFYALDEELYEAVFAELQSGGMQLDSYTEDSFHGTISVPEERTTVMTTIPFDEGWQVKIDGKPVEIYETLDALIAFDITPGEHQIDMEYSPAIYKTALTLCLAGVGAFALILAGEYVWGIIRRKYFSANH